MRWIDDPYWTDTLARVSRLSPRHRRILTPEDWVGVDSRYTAIDYGWMFDAATCTGFAIAKDDVDRLPAWLLESDFEGMSCVFANEVFVVFSSLAEDMADDDAERVAPHVGYFHDRLERWRAGECFRLDAINPRLGEQDATGSCVLIVNASHMGNFGDELLAKSAIDIVQRAIPGMRCLVVRPEFVIPRDLHVQAIVIGGGGVAYDHAERGRVRLEGQHANIGNYFKFGYIAQRRNVPFFVLGIGCQNALRSFVSIDAIEFIRGALKNAQLITTRDERSANEIRDVIDAWAPRPAAMPDLAFSGVAVARGSVGASSRRLALVGELGGFVACANAIRNVCDESGWQVVHVTQANEDPAHGVELARRWGVELETLDIRGLSVEDGVDALAGFGAIVTTRFHSLVIAVCNGVPAIALDNPAGKKSRLLKEDGLAADGHYQLIHATTDSLACESAVRHLLQRSPRRPADTPYPFADVVNFINRNLKDVNVQA